MKQTRKNRNTNNKTKKHVFSKKDYIALQVLPHEFNK